MEKYELTTEQRNAFRNIFRGERQKLGKTQEEVAQEAGLSQNFVKDIENGPREGIKLLYVARLINYYKKEPNEVFAALGLYVPNENEDFMVKRLCRRLSEVDECTLAVLERILQK